MGFCSRTLAKIAGANRSTYIGLTLISIMLAIVIGVPAGIYIARKTARRSRNWTNCRISNHSQYYLAWFPYSISRHWSHAGDNSFISLWIVAH